MLLTVTPVSPGELLMFLIGVALTLKKVVDMDRYHSLRVVILTTLAICIAMYVFNCVWFEAGMFHDCGFQNFSTENM